jgi:hypothetical protein
LVIAIGLLLLLHQVHGGNLSFGNTWPIIFVVIGFLHLASSMASREGHIEVPASAPPQAPYGNPGQ